MRFTVAPTLDELMDALTTTGWTIGDVEVDGEWLVHGRKGSLQIRARGKTRNAAWYAACEQARLLVYLKTAN